MDRYDECQLLANGDIDDSTLQKLSVRFIRGQDEIAIYQGRGNGRILSAWEAYKIFVPEIFEEILEYGTAVLSTSSEPAATFKKQREALDVSKEELSRKTHLTVADIEKVESAQYECDFAIITKLCKAMAIDDYSVAYQANDAASQLAYRLKETLKGGGIAQDDVLRMTECGWIADKQILLQTWLKEYTPISTKKNSDYGSPGHPAYAIGYKLAQQTRQLLGLSPSEPITSMRDLCRKINVPYILTKLSPTVAGATVATNVSRSIVANIEGRNENPLVRRLTVAHELAHLLWDPDENLQSLNVNLYNNFDIPYYISNDSHWIEQRANAFAVELLMPSHYLENRKNGESLTSYIRRIMITYGTSFTSTKYHLHINHKITQLELDSLTNDSVKVLTDATDEWKAQEDFTSDYFPIRDTPINKRGLFAYWVCKALDDGIISEDSAASFLDCSREDVAESHKIILGLF